MITIHPSWAAPPDARAIAHARYLQRRDKMRAYYAAHRDECRARDHAYYLANREKRRAAARAYYLANRDRLRATMREYWRKRKAAQG